MTKRDKYKKIQQDLAEAVKNDPDTIFVEMEFPIANDLAKYLKSIEKFGL